MRSNMKNKRPREGAVDSPVPLHPGRGVDVVEQVPKS